MTCAQCVPAICDRRLADAAAISRTPLKGQCQAGTVFGKVMCVLTLRSNVDSSAPLSNLAAAFAHLVELISKRSQV